eukprot:1157677-Pelagomonas_calceolata.AAC.6
MDACSAQLVLKLLFFDSSKWWMCDLLGKLVKSPQIEKVACSAAVYICCTIHLIPALTMGRV